MSQNINDSKNDWLKILPKFNSYFEHESWWHIAESNEPIKNLPLSRYQAGIDINTGAPPLSRTSQLGRQACQVERFSVGRSNIAALVDFINWKATFYFNKSKKNNHQSW